MPRIDASSIDEHIRVQTARILDAASALFRERGYRHTDMDDIAQTVGLARNSLYRYYRSKDFILLACARREMGSYLAQVAALEGMHGNPMDRIAAWLDIHMDVATGPAYATRQFMAEIRSDAPDLRKQLMEFHDAPAAILEKAVAEVLRGKRRDTALTVAMIKAMAEAAAAHVREQDTKGAVKRRLRRAVERILETRAASRSRPA